MCEQDATDIGIAEFVAFSDSFQHWLPQVLGTPTPKTPNDTRETTAIVRKGNVAFYDLIARAAKYQRSVVSVGEEKEKSDHMPRNSRFAAASADLISSNS